MSIREMVDARVRREREAAGERLVWLQPGQVVVDGEALEQVRDMAHRVR
jgi:hypothetical protein